MMVNALTLIKMSDVVTNTELVNEAGMLEVLFCEIMKHKILKM